MNRIKSRPSYSVDNKVQGLYVMNRIKSGPSYSVDNKVQGLYVMNRIKSVPRRQNYEGLGNFERKLTVFCAIRLEKETFWQRIRLGC